MRKKIMIAAGGTGGHIFPSIALAKQLIEKYGAEILFVGGGLSRNRFFDKEEFDFEDIACGPFTKNLFRCFKSATKIAKGVWQSKRLIKNFNPSCLIGFGSFYTFPTLIAAKMAKTPIILHEANAIPGTVNKMFSRYAVVTGVHMPSTTEYLKGPSKQVLMPLREGYKRGMHAVEEARRYFGLLANKLTMLVFGGSQGASSINRAFSQAILEHFPIPKDQFQVLHFTGDSAFADYARPLYQQNGILACVKNFEARMDLAWTAADLVISRAGASTITEAIEFEVPSILIPYPYAKDNHQEYNADFIVNEVKGGIKILDSQLNSILLGKLLFDLKVGGAGYLHHMRESIKVYKQNLKNMDFASLVTEIVEKRCKR